MGSVSIQSQICSQEERFSAVIDNEWDGANSLFSELSDEHKAAWANYHLIGDTLRSDDLVLDMGMSDRFLARFSTSLEAEPHLLAPQAQSRRRSAPAFAVAAAAAVLTWITVPQLSYINGGSALPASVEPGLDGGMQRVALVSTDVNHDADIIRDAHLDQYLEAHQQFAQQPTMTDSMPLMRAAVINVPGQ